MAEGREKAPSLSPELAQKIQNIVFWSFFYSQGSVPVQNSLINYAAANDESLAEVLDQFTTKEYGKLAYSKDFISKINEPLFERTRRYVGSPAHKRFNDAAIETQLFGERYHVEKTIRSTSDRSSDAMPKLIRAIQVQSERSKEKRQHTCDDFVHDVAIGVLRRDWDFYHAPGHRLNKNSPASIFTDRHFSHLCHFGFLKKPLPTDSPECFKDLFKMLPAVILTRARVSTDIHEQLENVIATYNMYHNEKVLTFNELSKQFGVTA